jgi:hypothetical protein
MSNPVAPWPVAKLITFRFLFVFLSLELFTGEFIVNMFGGVFFNELNLFMQRIFTPPFLFLNEQIFHFKYLPFGEFTFTHSLILVRHITYASIGIIVCIVWTIVDRERKQYSELAYWFQETLCMCLAAVMFAYGMIKVFPVQMQAPDFIQLHERLGNITPFDLFWTTMGFGTAYEIFSGVTEVAGALLVLFRRTRFAGLLILIIVLTNVVLINYTYTIRLLGFSTLLLSITFLLIVPYLKDAFTFFFTSRPVLSRLDYHSTTSRDTGRLLKYAGASIILVSFIMSFHRGYARYQRVTASSASRKYSEVTSFVADGDTLKNLTPGDSVRWQFWAERKSNGKQLVTIYPVKTSAALAYSVDRDTLNHLITMRPVNAADTSNVVLKYKLIDRNTWRVEGKFHGLDVVVDLRKVDPAKEFLLLQVKKQVIETDDEIYFR